MAQDCNPITWEAEAGGLQVERLGRKTSVRNLGFLLKAIEKHLARE
jgi:hypothetical protein